jgi:maltooligosyltrehalose trehalohydrolase
MGEEHGETRPFLYFTSHTDPDLGRAVSEGRRAEFIAQATEVPDPQAEQTFQDSRPAPSGDEVLRAHCQRMLAIRRKHRQVIATTWPRVHREGRAYRLERPGLTVTVNLGPAPALGLPGWGWEVSSR